MTSSFTTTVAPSELGEPLDERDQLVRLALGNARPVVRAGGEQAVAECLDRGQENDEVGAERIQLRGVVEHGLVHGVVLGLVRDDRESARLPEAAHDRLCSTASCRTRARRRARRLPRASRLPAQAHQLDVVESLWNVHSPPLRSFALQYPSTDDLGPRRRRGSGAPALPVRDRGRSLGEALGEIEEEVRGPLS